MHTFFLHNRPKFNVCIWLVNLCAYVVAFVGRTCLVPASTLNLGLLCKKKVCVYVSLSLYVAMTLMLPLTVLNLSFCFSVTFLYLLCVKHFKCMNVNTNKQIKHALLHIVTHKSKRFSNATKKQEILLEKSDL